MNDVTLKEEKLPFTIRWAKWKQNAKVVEKWEIVRNGLVNMFVMPVTMIDNAEIKLGIYLLFGHFSTIDLYRISDKE